MTELSVLLIEGAAWTAQCLEHDIAAQGDTQEDAMLELHCVISAQKAIEETAGRVGLERIPRAPDFYWQKFREAGQPRLASPLPGVPSVELEPASFSFAALHHEQVA